MLIIRKSQLNQLTITATEKSELTNPFWLFVFTHQEENRDYAVILANSSGFTARYDLFDFTEGTDLTLPKTGDYILRVYEQTSDSNLDPTATGFSIKEVHIEETMVYKTPLEYGENDTTVTRDIHELN